MQFTFTLPESLPQMTVKQFLEEQLLIPRKIRHFLRIKKNILINHKEVHWNEMVKPGDICQLTFDEEDYPPKEILWGNSDLVQEVYQDQHLIIVNKPEGMKTHGNQPGEIALLNHVSAYVGQTCYVVHRLDMETSGLILFAKNPFILPILNRLLEKKEISREYWALIEGRVESKELVFRDKIGRDRHDRRKRVVDPKSGQHAETQVSRSNAISKSDYPCPLQTKDRSNASNPCSPLSPISTLSWAILSITLDQSKQADASCLSTFLYSSTHLRTIEFYCPLGYF